MCRVCILHACTHLNCSFDNEIFATIYNLKAPPVSTLVCSVKLHECRMLLNAMQAQHCNQSMYTLYITRAFF